MVWLTDIAVSGPQQPIPTVDFMSSFVVRLISLMVQSSLRFLAQVEMLSRLHSHRLSYPDSSKTWLALSASTKMTSKVHSDRYFLLLAQTGAFGWARP